MYGRVNNIPFDIVVNVANRNEVAKQTSVQAAKMYREMNIWLNGDPNLICNDSVVKIQMEIKTNFPIRTLLLARVGGRTMTNDA